jgi:preprotein translocase subunit SecG
MQVLNIFHVLIAIALVAFILIQKGQGATAGAAFGSGASGTVFGARGAGNFLSRTTWVLAALFCTISLVMAVMVSRTSAVPENDLGVVGTSQTQDQTPLETQNSVLVEPAFESDESAGDAAIDIPVNTPGDLPSLDTEMIDNSVTDGIPAAEDVNVGEEPVTDGS